MKKNHNGDKIQSPCIRHCCLNDEDICVGCYRSLQEIIDWSAATDQGKVVVLEAARQRKKNAKNTDI